MKIYNFIPAETYQVLWEVKKDFPKAQPNIWTAGFKISSEQNWKLLLKKKKKINKDTLLW